MVVSESLRRSEVEVLLADADPDRWMDDRGNIRTAYDDWRQTSRMADGCVVAHIDPRPKADAPMLMAALVPEEMRDEVAAGRRVLMRCGRLWVGSGCRFVSLRLSDRSPWRPARVVVYRREAAGRPLRALHRPAAPLTSSTTACH
jgi:hypothetical protein